MVWEYKGINIEATPSALFKAVLDGVNIIKPSLLAMKKDIDKRQSIKALAVEMNLPVVILRESNRYSQECKAEIFHGVIGGLDPETQRITGIEAPERWQNTEILPESKENTRRLEKLMVARADLREAEKSIKGREFSSYISSPSRNQKPPYGDAVKQILANYEAAKSAKGVD